MENQKTRGELYLGTQGFSFDDWVGPFYPSRTPKGAYLEQYAQRLRTVEIDSTFYGAPRASVVKGWRERTPDGFKFSAKFPKLITHEKKLKEAIGDAHAFVGIMEELGDKLGVLALQFAYDFGPENFGLLDEFLGGRVSERTFLDRIRYRRLWPYDVWPAYRPMFEWARATRVPVVALIDCQRRDDLLESGRDDDFVSEARRTRGRGPRLEKGSSERAEARGT
jgi:hypothetical protein